MERPNGHKTERTLHGSAKQSAALAPVLLTAVYPLAVFREITGLDAWALRQARRNGLRVVKVGRRHFVRAQTLTPFWRKLESKQADKARNLARHNRGFQRRTRLKFFRCDRDCRLANQSVQSPFISLRFSG